MINNPRTKQGRTHGETDSDDRRVRVTVGKEVGKDVVGRRGGGEENMLLNGSLKLRLKVIPPTAALNRMSHSVSWMATQNATHSLVTAGDNM